MQPDDEAHQLVAKLTKAYDVTSAQLGPEHPCSMQIAIELRAAKQRMQASRPLGIRLQSAQSRLQGIEQALVKTHEEFEDLEEKIESFIKYRIEVTQKGRDLLVQRA